jgi:hypothetical protein
MSQDFFVKSCVFVIQFAGVLAFVCLGIAILGYHFNNAASDYSGAVNFFFKCAGLAFGSALIAALCLFVPSVIGKTHE